MRASFKKVALKMHYWPDSCIQIDFCDVQLRWLPRLGFGFRFSLNLAILVVYTLKYLWVPKQKVFHENMSKYVVGPHMSRRDKGVPTSDVRIRILDSDSELESKKSLGSPSLPVMWSGQQAPLVCGHTLISSTHMVALSHIMALNT